MRGKLVVSMKSAFESYLRDKPGVASASYSQIREQTSRDFDLIISGG